MTDGPAASPTVFDDVPVEGGTLRTAVWGTGRDLVLGIHGITASSLSLAPVARRLDERFTLLAPDLRGRGASATLPGPFGMRTHARDCLNVITGLGSGPVVVVGESMGAFVAVMLAAQHPERVCGLVLVDTLPTSGSTDDPEATLEAMLGPSLARLGRIFPTRGSYLAFWREHPAFADEWNADVEDYFLYDLEPVQGGWRSRVREKAVHDDGVETLLAAAELVQALQRVACPIALVRATRGLLDQPEPLVSDVAVDTWRRHLPQLRDHLVADTNHYTVMFGKRGAAAIAAAISEVADEDARSDGPVRVAERVGQS